VELVLEPDEHPGGPAVQGGSGRRRHPFHLVRRCRRARRDPAPSGTGRHLYARAGQDGAR
jgi:hypothetical protein